MDSVTGHNLNILLCSVHLANHIIRCWRGGVTYCCCFFLQSVKKKQHSSTGAKLAEASAHSCMLTEQQVSYKSDMDFATLKFFGCWYEQLNLYCSVRTLFCGQCADLQLTWFCWFWCSWGLWRRCLICLIQMGKANWMRKNWRQQYTLWGSARKTIWR